MDTNTGTASNAASHEERRQRKEDGWTRALRYLAMATYPLLILNILIFLAVASGEFNQNMAAQVAGQAPVEESHAGYLRAFLPLMAVGLVVGTGGILIDRKRSRRRRDHSYKSQLACIIVSAVGVAIYFLV